MPYDPKMDKVLFSDKKEYETTRITVSINQYNEGEKKIQISRENITPPDGKWKFAKLGRLLKSEAGDLLPMITKAIQNLD